MGVDFLSVGEVLRIHEDQIERYGGDASIRDAKALLSAVAMPQAGVEVDYLHEDIFAMAAAYLFHIVQNHPFVDGNKRTGTVAGLMFLSLNNVQVDIDNDELAAFVIGVAQGEHDKAAIAAFLRAGHGNEDKQ